MSDHLVRLVETAGNPRVLVVGDLMLDRYVWGETRRISGEGPIPILEVTTEESRAGGAGNVASNLAHLGARVTVCGVIGAQDDEGELIVRELKKLNVRCDGILTAPDRPTTLKTRFIGYVQSAHRGVQQMLRVDRESKEPIARETEEKLLAFIEEALPQQQCLVLTDYDKGLLTDRLLKRATEWAGRRGIPVITDPKLARPYSVYRGSTLLKPNRSEAQAATGIAIRDDESLRRAAEALIRMADLPYVLISLDRDGLYLAGQGIEGLKIPPRPKGDLVDISGAGDIIVSVVAWLLGCGVDVRDAAMLANVAAGVEVTKVGAVPVSRDEILNELLGGGPQFKIHTVEAAAEAAREVRRRNGKVVWTNGCFDILHMGHYEYLKFSRQQGDFLIVGLNSDESVRRLKGPNRPITGEAERARLLAALDVVDALVIFEEDTPLQAIKVIRPDVIVKGGDYREDQVVGWEVVKSYGGRVVIAPFIAGFSTTDIVKKIVERYKETGNVDGTALSRTRQRRGRKRGAK
jgi:D-beta-D-heptose 7-phosphate kinase/D-beta-D-heptose 1-phosphate adenosyltransferase